MTIWDQTPLTPVDLTLAGGEATLGEINDAARDAAIYVDNLNASITALDEAYQARIDAVRKATGVDLQHPLYFKGGTYLNAASDDERWRAPREAAFMAELRGLEARFPDARRDIRAQVPVIEDARLKARETETRLSVLMASREDALAPFASAVGGGFMGSLRDPIQVATLFVGGGAGGARTIAGKILSTAFREAVVNGAVEAALQPQVQAWRKEAGLPHGFNEAARNVLFAAGTAGVLGGAGRAAGEALAGLGRTFSGAPRLAEGDAVFRALPPEAPLRRAAEGDAGSLIERLGPLRDSLPPAQRGALDALEGDFAVQQMRRPSVAADAEDDIAARAMVAAEQPEQMADFTTRMQAPAEGELVPAPVPGLRADAAPDGTPLQSGIHGPVLPPDSYGGDWGRLVARMRELDGGDAPGAIRHKEVGDIDVIWGNDDGGLKHILRRHPEVAENLPALVADMTVVQRGGNRIRLESPDHRAMVRLDYDGAAKQWLLSAYGLDRRGSDRTGRAPGFQTDAGSSASPVAQHIGTGGRDVEAFEPGPHGLVQSAALEPEFKGMDDMVLPVAADGDGAPVMQALSDALEEARKGEAMAAFVEGCVTL